jgi:hypothetical protein
MTNEIGKIKVELPDAELTSLAERECGAWL